nr:zinc knuckle CX2CX4HX4C [Tanacetum cinerariifolium]
MVTTNMCKMGTDRVGFARVLIEVEAKKGLPNSIDIVFKDRENIMTVEEMEEMDKVKASKNEDKDDFVQAKNSNSKKSNEESSKKNNHDPRGSMGEKGSPGNKSNTGWVVQQDIIDSIRTSANKFSVLQDGEEGIEDNEKDL